MIITSGATREGHWYGTQSVITINFCTVESRRKSKAKITAYQARMNLFKSRKYFEYCKFNKHLFYTTIDKRIVFNPDGEISESEGRNIKMNERTGYT